MEITLNYIPGDDKTSDTNIFWMLPGTGISLSFENAGPIDVDVNTLNKAQKQLVLQAIRLGIVKSPTPQELLDPTIRTSSPETIMPSKSYNKTESIKPAQVEERVFSRLDERVKTVKGILNKPLGTIKKELPKKSLTELRILQQEEKAAKKRKTILSAIEKLIDTLQLEVSRSIGGKDLEVDAKDVAKKTEKELKGSYLDNLTDVVESDEEEITIKLGFDEDDIVEKA